MTIKLVFSWAGSEDAQIQIQIQCHGVVSKDPGFNFFLQKDK